MFAPKLTTDTSPELPFRLEGRLSAPDSVKSSVFDTSASNNVKNVLQSCFYIQLIWYTLIANSLFIGNRHHARSLRTGRRIIGRPFSLRFMWREATTRNKSALAGYHPRFFCWVFAIFGRLGLFQALGQCRWERRAGEQWKSERAKNNGRSEGERLWASWQTLQSTNYPAHIQNNRFSCQNGKSLNVKMHRVGGTERLLIASRFIPML